jgi:cytochrome b6
MKNWPKELSTWLDDRFGLSAITQFLKEKPVPQHKHSIWLYTGSAILLFFVIQVVTGFMLILYYNGMDHPVGSQLVVDIHDRFCFYSSHQHLAHKVLP